MENALEIINLTKKYGQYYALRDLNFTLKKGQILGVLGPNGAGKSTCSRIILGLEAPSSGTILFQGMDLKTRDVKEHLSSVLQRTDFHPRLRVKEVLDLARSHYKNPRPLSWILDYFGLGHLAHRFIGTLSGGQSRLIAIAAAFVGHPQVLVLDEPTTGLDVEIRTIVWEKIKEFSRAGGSIMLTTHYLNEAEYLCDHVTLIAKGQVIKSGSIGEVKREFGYRVVSFEANALPEILVKSASRVTGMIYEFASRDSDAFIRTLVQERIDFKNLCVRELSLDEIYRVEMDKWKK